MESPNHRLQSELLDELRSLELPVSDYAIFGSGPLFVRGWISRVGDLDLLARGDAWARAQELGTRTYLEEWNITVVTIGPRITVGTTWAIGEVDTDTLIDSAELIHGLPFAPLDAVVAYKRLSKRPKDLIHLKAIERNRGI